MERINSTPIIKDDEETTDEYINRINEVSNQIDLLWNKRFSKSNAEDITTKGALIQQFIDMLDFCDTLTPNFNNIDDLDTNQLITYHYVDSIKNGIRDGILKHVDGIVLWKKILIRRAKAVIAKNVQDSDDSDEI